MFSSDASSDEQTPQSPRKRSPRKRRGDVLDTPKGSRANEADFTHDDDEDEDQDISSSLLKTTASDAYFTYHHTRQPTSNSVFSNVYPPLSQEEYLSANPSYRTKTHALPSLLSDPALFRRFAFELEQGFNLIFYGYGSKLHVLNGFARDVLSRRGHVVISNAYRPDFTIKALMNTIEERIPGLAAAEGTNVSAAVDAQARRIYSFFSSRHATTSSSSKGKGKGKAKQQDKSTKDPPLFLIIHNIDAPPLRTPKAKSLLSLLALCPSIHIVASVDHINAPLLFSLQDASARKHPPLPPPSSSSDGLDTDDIDTPPDPPASRGYNWLWHDLTTLRGYDVETAYADRSSIAGLALGRKAKEQQLLTIAGGLSGGAPGAQMTETAARHVLASVTNRAKDIFNLLARQQLANLDAEALEDSGPGSNSKGGGSKAGVVGKAGDMQRYGMSYASLYRLSYEKMFVTGDPALQALLGEFRDHGLVLTSSGGGLDGEVLWIPLRKERLVSVLESIEASSQA